MKDARTWTAAHLNAAKARAAACSTPAEAEALAAVLVAEGRTGHVAAAVYDPALRRINVALHAGQLHVAFPLEIALPPGPLASAAGAFKSTLPSDVPPAVAVEV